jgi:4-diphosphocytidyl-2-C-methyl-D-erythritol kinase
MASLVRAFAPSKVNLALSVGAPGADGMHPISSWMATTRFGDDLALKRLPPGTPSRYAIEWHDDARRRTEIDWKLAKDLAVRAHRALEERLGRELPVQMRLQKRIPVGGGLGGGSSNAAAMLRALDALFDLRLRPAFLEHLGSTLGSDVPFLVRGGSAIVGGLGESLAPAAQHRTHLVLVFPDAQCPTGAVYKAFDALRRDARVEAARVRALAEAGASADSPFNDLADAACHVAPLLAEVRAGVEELARQAVHVSGSGSTLFLVCDSAVHADVLADAIETKLGHPALSTVTAPTPAEEVDGEPRVEEPEGSYYGDDE